MMKAKGTKPVDQITVIEGKPVSLDKTGKAAIVTIASAKGGVGKTTIAVSLACGLASRGLKILLVDLDPNISSTVWLLIDEEGQNKAQEYNIGNLLLNTKLDMTKFTQRIAPGSFYNMDQGGSLDFLPGGNNTSKVENQLVAESGSESRLQRILEKVRDRYDIILLDSPGKIDGKLTINAFAASTHYLVPVVAEFLPMASSVITDARMEDIKENVNSHIKFLGLVLNMFNPRLAKTKRTLQQLNEQFQSDSVFTTRIPHRTDYANIPGDGASYLFLKNKELRKVMDELVDEFLSRLGKGQ